MSKHVHYHNNDVALFIIVLLLFPAGVFSWVGYGLLGLGVCVILLISAVSMCKWVYRAFQPARQWLRNNNFEEWEVSIPLICIAFGCMMYGIKIIATHPIAANFFFCCGVACFPLMFLLSSQYEGATQQSDKSPRAENSEEEIKRDFIRWVRRLRNAAQKEKEE